MFPKITCVCLTCRDLWMLNLATKCFRNQTYPNKELLVISDSNNSHIKEYQRDNKDVNVILTEPNVFTLGDKRNLAVKESTGDYIATWDDDDIFHYKRLELQYKRMADENKKACVLKRMGLHNYQTDTFWISPIREYYNQTVIYHKDCFIPYPSLNYGEDMDILYKLVNDNCLSYIVDIPHLYIYTHSGKNVTPMMKWKAKLFYAGTKLITKPQSEWKAFVMMKETGGYENILNV